MSAEIHPHIHTVRHTFGVSCILLITNTRFIGLSNFLARTQTMVVGGFSTANSGKTQKTSFPIPSSVCVCVCVGKPAASLYDLFSPLENLRNSFPQLHRFRVCYSPHPPFPSDLHKRKKTVYVVLFCMVLLLHIYILHESVFSLLTRNPGFELRLSLR